jgi:hypothetical protein
MKITVEFSKHISHSKRREFVDTSAQDKSHMKFIIQIIELSRRNGYSVNIK